MASTSRVILGVQYEDLDEETPIRLLHKQREILERSLDDNERKNVRSSFVLNTVIPFIQANADQRRNRLPPPPYRPMHSVHDLPVFCMTLHHAHPASIMPDTAALSCSAGPITVQISCHKEGPAPQVWPLSDLWDI